MAMRVAGTMQKRVSCSYDPLCAKGARAARVKTTHTAPGAPKQRYPPPRARRTPGCIQTPQPAGACGNPYLPAVVAAVTATMTANTTSRVDRCINVYTIDFRRPWGRWQWLRAAGWQRWECPVRVSVVTLAGGVDAVARGLVLVRVLALVLLA